MKKLISMLAVLTLIFSVCAFANAEGTAYQVGILQFVQHPALDEATRGFREALTEKLGDSVVFTEENASGEVPNCATIASQLVAKQVNLIMANATPPLQACTNATGDIPVLGTSVTDYQAALEIELVNDATGINVSGTSDLAPLDRQADMIRELFPEAKTVGLLYCSGEANSIFQIKKVEEYLTAKGIETKRYAFTDSNDLASVTQTATECDVIYIPTDNTAANNTEAIANIVIPAKVPVIAGEEGICKGCGIATLSISYYDIGWKTGEMAYEILVNGADISTMPIEYAPQVVKEYNAANAAELGVTIPEDYLPIGE